MNISLMNRFLILFFFHILSGVAFSVPPLPSAAYKGFALVSRLTPLGRSWVTLQNPFEKNVLTSDDLIDMRTLLVHDAKNPKVRDVVLNSYNPEIFSVGGTFSIFCEVLRAFHLTF